ncbi:MAG: phytanoyl-CoA dioxygenase family protein, partial [Acidimicrobiales bacterium]
MARTLSTADADQHAAEIAERGYTIVEDAVDAELAAALVADLDRLHAELDVRPADNSFEGHHTLRVYNLLVHGEVWQQVPVHANVLPVVERVLDHGCLISSLSSITILPGETAQPIHADDQLIPIPKPHPPTVCNT